MILGMILWASTRSSDEERNLLFTQNGVNQIQCRRGRALLRGHELTGRLTESLSPDRIFEQMSNHAP